MVRDTSCAEDEQRLAYGAVGIMSFALLKETTFTSPLLARNVHIASVQSSEEASEYSQHKTYQ